MVYCGSLWYCHDLGVFVVWGHVRSWKGEFVVAVCGILEDVVIYVSICGILEHMVFWMVDKFKVCGI